jgi:hypothetical protein
MISVRLRQILSGRDAGVALSRRFLEQLTHLQERRYGPTHVACRLKSLRRAAERVECRLI